MLNNDALEWEIERLRVQGYEPFLVAFANGKGHVRTISNLDTEALRGFLEGMVNASPEIDEIAEVGS